MQGELAVTPNGTMLEFWSTEIKNSTPQLMKCGNKAEIKSFSVFRFGRIKSKAGLNKTTSVFTAARLHHNYQSGSWMKRKPNLTAAKQEWEEDEADAFYFWILSSFQKGSPAPAPLEAFNFKPQSLESERRGLTSLLLLKDEKGARGGARWGGGGGKGKE